jgi:hypothetical protein
MIAATVVAKWRERRNEREVRRGRI